MAHPTPHAAQPLGSAPAALGEPPAQRREPARILGIQPVLFVGILLLIIVTIITVVLIFIGDFENQAARVVWTIIAFLAFTGLLALDLVLARRRALPLVIGVIADIYMLALLMVATWIEPSVRQDPYSYPGSSEWAIVTLFGVYAGTIIAVRAGAAAAYGLVVLGERARAEMARIVGIIAAALVGLAAVLLTLPFGFNAFGIELSDVYWRGTVAVMVIAALAASVTVLLFWNRRNIDWQAAEARGEHHGRVEGPAGGALLVPTHRAPGPQPGQGVGQPFGTYPPVGPQPGASFGAPTGVAGQPAASFGAPTDADAAAQAARFGAPQSQPQQPQQPQQSQPQQPQQPLLPWPTFPNGQPLPARPDGQPDFSALGPRG